MRTERLNAKDVTALLAEHYGASGMTVLAIDSGPSSIAWKVTGADGSAFCLKDNKLRPLDKLRREHEFMQALRAEGFSYAPEAIPSDATTGDITVEFRGRTYSLYRWIDSDPAFVWTMGGWSVEHARAAGGVLGSFHRAAATVGATSEASLDEQNLRFCESRPRHADTRDWALSVLQRASGMFPSDVIIHLSKFDDLLRSASVAASDERTHGIIHGDYHPGNVLFRGSEAVGVLDFEYCRYDSRWFDVAYATMSFSFESMDPAFALAFLDGYAETFERLQIEQLQPLVRLSAWLSAIWLIEQCQKGAAGHDEVLPALRKCMAILSASLD